MSLSQSARDRLVKLVGMLGSAHDGERLAALGFITRMAAEHKMTITELLGHIGKGSAAPPPQQRPQWAQYPWWREPPSHPRPPPPPPPPPPKPPPPPPPPRQEKPVMKHNGLHGDQMLYDLEMATHYCSRLSSWERGFGRDVANRYRFDSELSDKQRSCVVAIVEKWKMWKAEAS
jgi:hypothetical protein